MTSDDLYRKLRDLMPAEGVSTGLEFDRGFNLARGLAAVIAGKAMREAEASMDRLLDQHDEELFAAQESHEEELASMLRCHENELLNLIEQEESSRLEGDAP